MDRSGLNALINSALVSHRRLPMLEVIFDRTARRMSTSLRQLTDENVEVTLEDVTSIRFGDFLQSQPQPVVIGVMRSAALDAYSLIVADGQLVVSIVDLLLGGRRGAFADVPEDRSFTAIELGLAQRMLTLLIGDFDESFNAVAKAEFSLDRIETTPRFAAISQEASVCALAKFKVRLEHTSVRASLIVPHSAIEPVKEKLMRDFIGEARGGDAAWSANLERGVRAARLDVRAVLAETPMTIGALERLKPGDMLTFNTSPRGPVELRSGERRLAVARLGRSGDQIAVKLDGAAKALPNRGEGDPSTDLEDDAA